MIYRNIVRFSSLVVIVALTLFSASTIARSSYQEPDQQIEASLMTNGKGITVGNVVLRSGKTMNAGANARGKPINSGNNFILEPRKRLDKRDGSFSFENLPFGTYNLTVEAPKLSPAVAGKVEYLVILQTLDPAKPGLETARVRASLSAGSFPPSTRIAVDKIKDGFDFTVGLQPQAGKTGGARLPTGPENITVRGKIFLVEIGTYNLARE